MTLHLNLPGSHHRSAEQQAELREARRLLREKIKNDWEYPTLPAWTSSGRKETTATATQDVEDRIAGFRFHSSSSAVGRTNGVVGEALGLGFEPREWRERDSSGASDGEGDSDAVAAPARKSTKSSKESVYKFDAPDSVGTQLNHRRQARKRKRNQALREEMEWNDGLAHWIRRRDLWCCARETRQVRLLEGSSTAAEQQDVPLGEQGQGPGQEEEAQETHSSTSSSPRASTSSSLEAQQTSSGTPDSTPSVTPDVTGSTPPTTTTTTTALIPLDVLVPIAPPLLPNHPVRRRITTNSYPEIYNKIILQSRTPSIPINLLTLINALVQGWKDNGEWPPKPGPLEKAIGRKKGSSAGGGHHEGGGGSLRQGVKAVGRVLRLTGVGEHA